MCTTLCFLLLYILSMLATKNLVSIHHHTVDPLYPFCPHPHPSPSGNHYSVLCIYAFVFVLFDFFLYATYE